MKLTPLGYPAIHPPPGYHGPLLGPPPPSESPWEDSERPESSPTWSPSTSGAPVWENCWASLKSGGRPVSCGVTAGHRVSLHLGQLWMRRLSLIGSVNNPEVDLKIIKGLVEQGAVRPVVDSVIPLEDAAEAHLRLETRDFFGKIVLTVA